ncbi:MAG: hypothetical protein AAB784_00045 [Patescibacteria group bacterium]
MSDGITDSYRDTRRGELYDDFLLALADYLAKKTEANLTLLKKTANLVDDVPRGLMSGRTNLAQGLDDMLNKLLAQDKRTWGKLLGTALNTYPTKVYKRLKCMSPFDGQVLIAVDYGIGFVNLHGDIQNFLDHYIQRDKNMKIYDADKYIVAIPESALTQSDVTWLHCGYFGVKEPRKQRIG